MTKLILLAERPTISPKNRKVIVSDQDYDFLIQWKWCLFGRYAARLDADTKRTVYMHWAIINEPSGGRVIDHINGNCLDNRRENLRICTHAENMRNRLGNRNSRSRYKGVTWSKPSSKWHARIAVNNKHFHLGLFTSELDAAKAYDKAALEHHGAFARLNFPESE